MSHLSVSYIHNSCVEMKTITVYCHHFFYSFISFLLSSALQRLENKRTLVESCKALVEALKDKQEEAALHSRQALNDIEAVIEQEKKSFRSSQDDRLQKVRCNQRAV